MAKHDDIQDAVDVAIDRVREAQSVVADDLDRGHVPEGPLLDAVVRRADDLNLMVEEDQDSDDEADEDDRDEASDAPLYR